MVSPSPKGHCPCQRMSSAPSSHSPWDPLKDIAQFEQDGVLHTLQRETMTLQTRFMGGPGPRCQVSTPRAQPGRGGGGCVTVPRHTQARSHTSLSP